MDQEQREAFAKLFSELSDVASEQRQTTQTVRDVSRTVRRLEETVSHVSERVAVVEKQVFGSDPPPKLSGPSVARRVSTAESEMHELIGRVMRVESNLATNTEETKAIRELVADVKRAVGGFVANPKVKVVGWAIWMAVTAWLGSKGLLRP